jgi:hypothetical protein
MIHMTTGHDDKHDKPLRPIFDNPGFQNIAAAIRRSTVNLQNAKAMGQRPRYDIRYGLNQELARKARYPHEFMTALAEFVHKYNAENAQTRERRKNIGNAEDEGFSRRDVLDTDLQHIAALIDEYDAPLIANMLIAYGYARVRNTSPNDQTLPEQPEAQDAGEDH